MGLFSSIGKVLGKVGDFAGSILGGGGGALLSGGLSLLGSMDQSDAAERAAQYQAAGIDRATQAQLEMYYQSRGDMAPWREAGERSLADLERMQGTYEGAVMDPSQYVQSPGYGWLQQQGIDTLSKGASAAGKLGSGQYSKDLMQYGQGLALQDYSGYLGRLEALMNRYSGTAQVGQTASGTLAGIGQSAAGNLGSLYTQQGQAQAGGTIGQANARTGLYSNLANIGANYANQYALNQQLNRNNAYNTSYSSGGLANPYDQNASLGADWQGTNW